MLDVDDPFPYDPNESRDSDLDGSGDNADTDNDGDGWPDATEVVCETPMLDGSVFPDDNDGDGTCDLIDPDDDNDGWIDGEDAFPFDENEWADRNGDGVGDNGKPLTTMDHMRLNPEISVIGVGMVLSLVSAAVAFAVGSRRKTSEYYVDDEEGEYDEYAHYDGWRDEY